MEKEAALLYAQSATAEDWESEERESYDVQTLRKEYRNSLYSEKGEALRALKSASVEV